MTAVQPPTARNERKPVWETRAEQSASPDIGLDDVPDAGDPELAHWVDGARRLALTRTIVATDQERLRLLCELLRDSSEAHCLVFHEFLEANRQQLTERPATWIIWLPEPGFRDMSQWDRQLAESLANSSVARCILIGSAHAYVDSLRNAAEQRVVDTVCHSGADVRLVRVGRIEDSLDGVFNDALRFRRWARLIPAELDECLLPRQALGDLLTQIVDEPIPRLAGRTPREYALLGERRRVRDWLVDSTRAMREGSEANRPAPTDRLGVMRRWCTDFLAQAEAWGRRGSFELLSLFVPALARLKRERLPQVVRPKNTRELVALCKPMNRPWVTLVGFNTGVNHFGWKFPSQTLIQTTQSGRRMRLRRGLLEVDAGVLLKQAVDWLSAQGLGFYVLPNYSYISLGTVYMVPIHGSGCTVSTLGDTIEQAWVYNPSTDRTYRVRRGDQRFAMWMYNPKSGVVVLRLWFRVRPCCRYTESRSRLVSPSADDVWRAFVDSHAANVELRKTRATDDHVDVTTYFLVDGQSAVDGQSEVDAPRDAVGRLWDRIEENRLAAWLFHGLVRRFGYHVELFLNREEFETFWVAHRSLPLSKMQLRLVRCDQLPHSPVGDCDRISIDLFMRRSRCGAFLQFMREHLPNARFNHGKHSL